MGLCISHTEARPFWWLKILWVGGMMGLMITSQPKLKRRSIRMRGFDYSSPGGYYVTICTGMKQLYFGEIEKGEMKLSDDGNIAQKCWIDIPRHFPFVSIDRYVGMPNHVHGILWLNNMHSERKTEPVATIDCRGVQLNSPAGNEYFSRISPAKNTLGVIIRTYKAAVTTLSNKQCPFGFSWQRGYHDYVIRTEKELYAMRTYIINNPVNWSDDELYFRK